MVDCIWVIQIHLGGKLCFYAKVSFSDNLIKKNLTAAGVLRKIFCFLYLSLKLSLTLPPQGKNALVFIFKVLH